MATLIRNIFEVQRSVRVVLDQNKISDQLVAVGDVDTLSLDDMIRDAIPRAIRAVLLVAPGVMIEDAVSGVATGEVQNQTYGTVVEDFKATFQESAAGSGTNTYVIYSGTKVLIKSTTEIVTSTNGQFLASGFELPAGTVVGDLSTSYKTSFDVPVTHSTTLGTKAKVLLYSGSVGMDAALINDTNRNDYFYARVPLPQNFLRLLAFKMSDWDYMVDHATPRGDSTYSIQHSSVYSLRGNPHRPVVCVTPDGRNLEAFGSSDPKAKLEVFDYVAIPEIDTVNNTIPISDKLYPSVIYYCASLVCTSLGDFNKANAMQAIAMQYVTVNTNTNREIQSE